MAAFDPDKYLAETAQPAPAFDPDAYLAAPPVGVAADTAGRLQRGVMTGFADASEGLSRLGPQTEEQVRQQGRGPLIRLLRGIGLAPSEEEAVQNFRKRRAESEANRASIRQEAANIKLDRSRDGSVLGTSAEIAGNIVPSLAMGVSGAPVLGGVQMGGSAANQAREEGLSEEEQDSRFAVNAGIGTALNYIPGLAAARTSQAIRRIAPGAGPLITRGAQAAASGLEGAAVNTAGDVAIQLAEDGEVDLGRLRQNAALGFGIGALAGGAQRPANREIALDAPSGPAPVRINPEGAIDIDVAPVQAQLALDAPARVEPVMEAAAPAESAMSRANAERYNEFGATYRDVIDRNPDIISQIPPDHLPVEIRQADGTIVPAVMRSYGQKLNNERFAATGDVFQSVDMAPGIGYFTPDGISHGFLRDGDTLLTPIPTLEQWQAGIRDVSVSSVPEPVSLANEIAAPIENELSLAGARDASISNGSGTPTPYEAQMIADWRNSIAAEQAASGGTPPPPADGAGIATLPNGDNLPATIPDGSIAQPPMPPTIPPGGTPPPPAGGGGNVPLSIYEGPVDRVWGNLKKTLVDFAAPIEDTQRRFEKQYGYELDPNSSIANYIDRVLNSQKMGGQFAKDTGLFDVIQRVDDIDDFSNYLIDKHALDVEANGVKSGRDLAAARQNVAAKQAQYADAEAKVRNVADSLLQRSVQYGLISPDTAAYLNELYPNYVPFDRVFDELERSNNGSSNRPIASLGRQTAIRQFEGSERPIENPLGSFLKKIEDVFTQGERNIAARTLAEYRNLPGWSDIIRELPEGRSAPHTFSYLDNGVKRTFEAPKEIAEAAKNLNYQTLGPVLNALAIPVRIARAGITGLSIPFTLSNVVRDQITTHVQRDTPEAFMALPKALWEAVGHGETYDEMIRQGALSTSYDLARNNPMETVERIRSGRSLPSKVAYTITHPSEFLRQVENVISRSEELARLQNFIRAQESALARGLSPEQAVTEASRAARNTTANFSRRGEWGTVLNSLWLYLNAGIQSSRATYRAFRRNPIATTAKVGIGVMTPVALATLWNTNDEERKKAYEDIPDYEKESNIILLPPSPVKDENGRWDAIKIPLPPGFGRLAGLARRPIEALRGLDPVAAGDIARSLIGPFTPIEPETNTLVSNITPMAGRPIAEASLNKNFFTGANIVPEPLKKLPTDMQYDDKTSRLAIAVGHATDISPMKVDHMLRGYFGEAGQNAINAMDKAAALFDDPGVPERVGGRSIPEGIARRFTSVAGGETARRFYEWNTTANQAREGYRRLALQGNPAEADAFYNANKALIDAAPLLNNIQRQLSTINRLSRSASSEDKAENKRLNALRDTYVREGNRIMREIERKQR